MPQITLSRPACASVSTSRRYLGSMPGVVHADAVPDQPRHVLPKPAVNRKPPISSPMASFSARLHTLTLISAWACSIAAAWVKWTT